MLFIFGILKYIYSAWVPLIYHSRSIRIKTMYVNKCNQNIQIVFSEPVQITNITAFRIDVNNTKLKLDITNSIIKPKNIVSILNIMNNKCINNEMKYLNTRKVAPSIITNIMKQKSYVKTIKDEVHHEYILTYKNIMDFPKPTSLFMTYVEKFFNLGIILSDDFTNLKNLLLKENLEFDKDVLTQYIYVFVFQGYDKRQRNIYSKTQEFTISNNELIDLKQYPALKPFKTYTDYVISPIVFFRLCQLVSLGIFLVIIIHKISEIRKKHNSYKPHAE